MRWGVVDLGGKEASRAEGGREGVSGVSLGNDGRQLLGGGGGGVKQGGYASSDGVNGTSGRGSGVPRIHLVCRPRMQRRM